jgi:uncharacterized protein YeaO (DUF488 family)
MIRVKRVYDPPEPADGCRILVDRLWPRGLSRERAAVDLWLRDVAPSDALRQWYGHEPARWPEFKRRYHRELQQRAEALAEIRSRARGGTVTLLYAASDRERNNAVALAEFLEHA